MYSHISPSPLNRQHVAFYILRHSRRSETEQLRVFWLREDFFFPFCGNFEWHSRIVEIWGLECVFFKVICGWSQALIQFHSNVVFSNRFHFNSQFQEAVIAKINWVSHSR